MRIFEKFSFLEIDVAAREQTRANVVPVFFKPSSRLVHVQCFENSKAKLYNI